MNAKVTVTVAPDRIAGRRLLAPVGTATPHQTTVSFAVRGTPFALTGETTTGQMAALIAPTAGRPVTLTYGYRDIGSCYPDPIFRYRESRYTRAADALVRDARRIAESGGGGHAVIAAIVNDVAERFVYGHPEIRFNDGMDEVPYGSCGLAEGSCVDINTYLIASLRSAGYEAGYVTGYFFPAEKKTWCDDMHCWVVTRHAGVVAEWDIAHHLKMGVRHIRPGLNPKPGRRVAVCYSMGLNFPALGIRELKLLAEPVWVDADGRADNAELDIRLRWQDGEGLAEAS